MAGGGLGTQEMLKTVAQAKKNDPSLSIWRGPFQASHVGRGNDNYFKALCVCSRRITGSN